MIVDVEHPTHGRVRAVRHRHQAVGHAGHRSARAAPARRRAHRGHPEGPRHGRRPRSPGCASARSSSSATAAVTRSAGASSRSCRWPSCWRCRSGSAPRRCCRRSAASGGSATAAPPPSPSPCRPASSSARWPRALTNLPDVWPARARHDGRRRARRRRQRRARPGRGRASAPALVLRFVTGVAMAGAYPPAMKIMATWFREGRGLAIGILVGALTVGSAAPHLDPRAHRPALAGDPAGRLRPGAAGGAGRRAGVRARGPARVSRRPLRPPDGGGHLPRARRRGWPASATSATCGSSTRCGRGSACSWPTASRARGGGGYAGRQRQRRHVPGDRHRRARLLGRRPRLRPVGPHDADDGRHGGERRLRGWRSASPSAGRPLLTLLVAVVWGVTVIADSAQFSTAITELSPPAYVGTALTTQTCAGFALTMRQHLAHPARGRGASAGAGRSPRWPSAPRSASWPWRGCARCPRRGGWPAVGADASHRESSRRHGVIRVDRAWIATI